ncbi:MAG TPA: CdvA-like protein [Nitrososphaera sp.]|jgi:ribosomal protein L29|nr:CdvA-like protein [Nitrososphaera sp.]
MSEEKLGFVGKQVKDIYGTFIGKVVGIITEINGEVETVGVDCGSGGLRQLPYEQLVMQGDYVFFIPRWRLDAQKLLRQKSLTLKRIKALQDIVAENDSMREDAELVSIKYQKKLNDLEESEKQTNGSLDARVKELDAEARNIRAVLFDAKLQFRSNEMKEETYQQIKVQTDELIEHINNEKTEIANVRTKLASQTLDNITAATTAPITVTQTEQTPAVDNAATEQVGPAVQVTATGQETVTPVAADGGTEQVPAETSWLNQVITK